MRTIGLYFGVIGLSFVVVMVIVMPVKKASLEIFRVSIEQIERTAR